MSELERRAHQADLEIRGADGRTVVGIAVPFDRPSEVRSLAGRFTETFRPGSFARTIAERGDRVKFLAEHDQRSFPLGRATLLREDTAGLYGEFRVSKTTAGDEALELIRDGALDSLSVGFKPVTGGDQWATTRSHVDRLEVALYEVSATAFPIHEGAEIMAVRSFDQTGYLTATEIRALEDDRAPAVVLDARAVLDRLVVVTDPRARLAALTRRT